MADEKDSQKGTQDTSKQGQAGKSGEAGKSEGQRGGSQSGSNPTSGGNR